MSRLDEAMAIHIEACRPYETGEPRDPHLASPFGTPEDMPPHVWRVSRDVLQELYNASPPPVGPNPKNGDDGTIRLCGWPIHVSASFPDGTMRLDPA